MTPTRILITGSRDWSCSDLAQEIVLRLRSKHGPALVIVHGDCPTGVDAAFATACEELGVTQERHPADWTKGRSGGPIRNGEMVRAGALLTVAFSMDLARSKGTLDCCRQAFAAGIPVWVFEGEDVVPADATPKRLISVAPLAFDRP